MAYKPPAVHGRDHRPKGADPPHYAAFVIKVFADTEAVTTGDGLFIWHIPYDLDGWDLVTATAGVTTVSSSGALTIQIRNVTQAVDMLSTAISIPASGFSSFDTGGVNGVPNTSNNSVVKGNRIAIDVDAAGTGAQGLVVHLHFEL